MSSDKLIDEYPLILLPSLAAAIGLNEAIVLQQVHYWVSNPKVGVVKDGRRWAWNKIAEWQEQFPFWSERTIRRVVKSARDMGCLLVEKHNDKQYDQTNYYSVDYDRLKQLILASEKAKSLKSHNRSICPVQGGQVVRVEEDNVASSLTETTADTTKTENTNILQTPLVSHDASSQTSNKFDVFHTNAEKSTESEKTKVPDEKPTKEAAYLASKAVKQKPEKPKATTKPKKALFASQLDNRSHPFTLAALRALECEIEANPNHNIWVDSKTHRPMVQIAVLDDIEENLQALGEAMEDVNDGNSPVEAACIAVIDFYKDRGMNRKRPVDLSFLSGVGMADSPEDFVKWFSHAIYC